MSNKIKKELRILEIHGTATIFGGASNGTKILIEEIQKKGIPIFLCLNKNNQVLKSVSVDKLLLNLSSKNPFIIFTNLIKIYLFLQNNKINAVHTHHRNDTIYSCIIKFFIPNIRIVYTVHGISIGGKEIKYFYRFLSLLFLLLVNKKVNSIIYISNFTKLQTEHFFKNVKRQRIIHNGTSIPVITQQKELTFKTMGVKYDSFIISVIGDIGGVKRPQLVIELAEKLTTIKDLFFVFIGDGNEREEIINICKNRNLNNIIFIEPTSEIGNFINASSLVISMAYVEGFGRTLIEAMALSKPVMAFNNGGPKEIILNNFNGFLIEEGNIEEYAQKIRLLVCDKEKALSIGENGYKRFLEFFSSEKYTEEYLKEYTSILT